MKNNTFNSADVKKVCENKLGIKFRTKGKEYNGWYKYNQKKVARITTPKGRKRIPPKTYKMMATQLKLGVVQFDKLLECPLKSSDYAKIIEELIISNKPSTNS